MARHAYEGRLYDVDAGQLENHFGTADDALLGDVADEGLGSR